ncbi:uncharacterized protein LOC134844581 isoform X2 [Symsagittifera roscoffensis]|uniref:uncharacterized protein LOC134844581 isoform X2 n=1 Tax=Symsagittifera roscoffensis TaxID=84072 RepID=UPI00307BFA9D
MSLLEDTGLKWHSLLSLSYVCNQTTASFGPMKEWIESEIHIEKTAQKREHNENKCHQITLPCTFNHSMKVTVLLMDPLASLETVDIVMKLVHYRGKTLPGRESSSNVTTILGTVETRLTITPPSVEEQIKPTKHPCVENLVSRSIKDHAIDKQIEDKANVLNIAVTAVCFVLFLLIITLISTRNLWIGSNSSNGFRVFFASGYRSKSAFNNRKKYDEAMANDEEEDYAVLITEKGSESFSTEKLSTDHFLNSDSELELFSNRLF